VAPVIKICAGLLIDPLLARKPQLFPQQKGYLGDLRVMCSASNCWYLL
jgi:hypothetical protein